MDQKLKGYARSAENKRRLDNNPRDNREQQPVFKRQNVGGQNVARAYTAGNNEKKEYVGSLPYYNKCKLHHARPCTVRCGNYKRVGYITSDCTTTVTPNTQRAPVGNPARNKKWKQDWKPKLEVMRLRRRLTLLEEEDQTPIQTSLQVRSFSITVMLLCYSIREPIGVLCRLPLVPCLMLPPSTIKTLVMEP
ncbi:hypothetical protein Tco_0572473 [Tanacetum coccineum]